MNPLRVDALRHVVGGTALVTGLFAARFHLLDRPRSAALMAATALVHAGLFFARVTSPVAFHVVLLLDVVLSTLAPVVGGGPHAPLRIALALLPAFAAYVGGWRPAVLWAVVAVVAALLQGALFELFPQANEWRAGDGDFLVGQVGMIVLFALATVAARREGDALLGEAHARSEALATANAHAAELMVALSENQARLEETADALARARDEAMAAVRAKDAFVASVSHELRTPLHGILAAADLLDAKTAGAREVSAMLRTSGTALLGTVNDVLSLSKSAAGADPARPSETNVLDLVEDCLAVVAPTAAQRELGLVFEIEEAAPEVVWLDGDKLSHVVTNLVGNALKFTPRGDVTVVVGPAEGGVRVVVRDAGPGVPESSRASIFEPFVQTAIASAQKGTGLGLAIVRRFVDAMGGTITVGDAPGGGAEFTVVVPCAVESTFRPIGWAVTDLVGGAEADRAALRRQLGLFGVRFDAPAGPILVLGTGPLPPTGDVVRVLRLDEEPPDDVRVLRLPVSRRSLLAVGEGASESHALTRQEPLTVLVVDDNLVNQKVATRFLQALGHNPLVAATAAEGLRLAEEAPVDVILLDRRLPDGDGLEMLGALREAGVAAKVVLITADPTAREEALSRGAYGFLSKPASLEDFREVLAGPAQSRDRVGVDRTKLASLRSAPPLDGKTFLAELLETFEPDAEQILRRLRTLVAANADLPTVGDLAHRLAGSSGSLGLDRVSEAALTLERQARAGSWPPLAAVSRLERELSVGVVALRAWSVAP